MYSLDHVVKNYGTVSVLKEITCTMPVDGFVFLMGPSGSGKSTLLRLLSFVETPDFGTVSLTLDGDKFYSNQSNRPWPRVTTVFQRQFLWPHLTLRENISLPLRFQALNPEKQLQGVVDLFDMGRFIDRYPNEVSGGQATRAALARALVLHPQLILIDEPHGGLDLEQQKILNDHLVTLRQAGVGLIVVTHSLEFARKYADQIFVLEDGRITESGIAELLDNPKSSFLKRVLGV
jgi:ABC-type Fe3+/spermidine/putrescine transport system ATPase subunit